MYCASTHTDPHPNRVRCPRPPAGTPGRQVATEATPGRLHRGHHRGHTTTSPPPRRAGRAHCDISPRGAVQNVGTRNAARNISFNESNKGRLKNFCRLRHVTRRSTDPRSRRTGQLSRLVMKQRQLGVSWRRCAVALVREKATDFYCCAD